MDNYLSRFSAHRRCGGVCFLLRNVEVVLLPRQVTSSPKTTQCGGFVHEVEGSGFHHEGIVTYKAKGRASLSGALPVDGCFAQDCGNPTVHWLAGRSMSTGIRRRDQIASYIEHYAAEHGGNSPSLQEIADALQIGKTTVVEHVQKLIDEGRAMRRDGKLWLTQPLLFPLPDHHDKA